MIKNLFRRYNILLGVFGRTDGKEALAVLGEMAGIRRSAFVPGDPYRTAYNTGVHDFYYSILQAINQNPELIRRALQQEADQEQLGNFTQTKGEY